MVRGAGANDTTGIPTDIAPGASCCHMPCRSTFASPLLSSPYGRHPLSNHGG
ncbi:hypothetical protein BIFPSEUDO_03683 [Bifidobacterium pseudocatenulatum DSM 20438 = JCM 1200 = LMG 10505]|uniref:Uncharacterized protein n=1 Tax=Bifidobacterium pseudocatenulatum DSM 20438 = JCM 1200 = LMG 10505 TaxID=547043 RepID=C0BTF9_BIFPS|nr:hypothetical protein BIFPSEUDO_03683 [Bifidobacterium pseudocatenulatum DSM 20438 = JCM 1200 = LMG 10505]